MSADGRFIAYYAVAVGAPAASAIPAFASSCSECVRVFVLDTMTGARTMVGADMWGGSPAAVHLSADGRHVLFRFNARHTLIENTPGAWWVSDLDTGRSQRLGLADATDASISGDGRRVAFTAPSRYFPGQGVEMKSIGVFDRADLDAPTKLLLVTNPHGAVYNWADQPVLSDDGQTVRFWEASSDGTSPVKVQQLSAAPPIPALPTQPPRPVPQAALPPLTRVSEPDSTLAGIMHPVSADGRFVITWSQRTGVVTRTDRSTGAATALHPSGGGTLPVVALDDGSGILYSTGSGVAWMRFDTGEVTPVPGVPAIDDIVPVSASADGSVVLVVAWRTRHLFRVAGGVATDVGVTSSTGGAFGEISADGRLVTYGGYPNGSSAVVRYDAVTGATSVLISGYLDGQAVTGVSFRSATRDGRYVAIGRNTASNMSTAAIHTHRLIVLDTQTGSTREFEGWSTGDVSISADGDLVAYTDMSTPQRVILADRTPDTPDNASRVISAPPGVTADGFAYRPALSADGTLVAFDTFSTNLSPGDTFPDYEVFAMALGSSPIYTPLKPARVLDTRQTGQTVDGRFVDLGSQQAGQRLEVQIAGRGGVPTNATTAVLNVTVTGSDGSGFVTVWPCDSLDPPNASSLNFAAGQDVANAAVVALSSSGTVCIRPERAATHLIADVNGFFPAGSAYRPLSPQRLLDTRPAQTVDRRFENTGVQPAGQRIDLQVSGRTGIPADAAAVVLNVTATGASDAGFVTVWPCDTAGPPNASSLNFAAGADVPNTVIVPLSPSGTVCIEPSVAATHLLADINGYFPAGASFRPLSPQRLLDTRATGSTADGRFVAGGQQPPGARLEVEIAGRGGIAANATAAVLNVTVTGEDGGGFVTVWPCDTADPPNASTINYVAGRDVANAAVVPLSSQGTVCLQPSLSATHLIVDATGYFPG